MTDEGDELEDCLAAVQEILQGDSGRGVEELDVDVVGKCFDDLKNVTIKVINIEKAKCAGRNLYGVQPMTESGDFQVRDNTNPGNFEDIALTEVPEETPEISEPKVDDTECKTMYGSESDQSGGALTRVRHTLLQVVVCVNRFCKWLKSKFEVLYSVVSSVVKWFARAFKYVDRLIRFECPALKYHSA